MTTKTVTDMSDHIDHLVSYVDNLIVIDNFRDEAITLENCDIRYAIELLVQVYNNNHEIRIEVK